MNAFKAFTVSSLAVALAPVDRYEAGEASDPASQFIDSSVARPCYHVPHTFNKDTFELEPARSRQVHPGNWLQGVLARSSPPQVLKLTSWMT